MDGIIGKRIARVKLDSNYSRVTLDADFFQKRIAWIDFDLVKGFSRNWIVSINCLARRLQNDVSLAARGCDR